MRILVGYDQTAYERMGIALCQEIAAAASRGEIGPFGWESPASDRFRGGGMFVGDLVRGTIVDPPDMHAEKLMQIAVRAIQRVAAEDALAKADPRIRGSADGVLIFHSGGAVHARDADATARRMRAAMDRDKARFNMHHDRPDLL